MSSHLHIPNQEAVELRRINRDDTAILQHMTHLAMYAGSMFPPTADGRHSGWYEDWNEAEGDGGFIAQHGDEVLGAAWCRRFWGSKQIYGDSWDDVPELIIAVESHARGQGYGELLLDAVIDDAAAAGTEQLSLQVDRRNKAARRLYERKAFRAVYDMKHQGVVFGPVMVLDLRSDSGTVVAPPRQVYTAG